MWMLRLVPGAKTLMLFVIVMATYSQLIAMPAVSGAEGGSSGMLLVMNWILKRPGMIGANG
jgi:prolyl oligopeptidase PreP (S9A serine peptidase family)